MSSRRRRSQASRLRRKRIVRPEPSRRWRQRLPVLLVADRTRGGERGHVVLEGAAQRLLGPQPGEGQVQDASRISRPSPCPWWARPSHDRSPPSARRGSARRSMSWTPTGRPSTKTAPRERPLVRRPVGPVASRTTAPLAGPAPGSSSVHGMKNGMVAGIVDARRRPASRGRRTRPPGGAAARAGACARPGRRGARTSPAPRRAQPPGW